MPELKRNPEPVCPYCGHIESDTSDAWELHLYRGDDRTEVNCVACGLPFIVELNLIVSYNTYPLKEKVSDICNSKGIAISVSLTDD